MGDAASLAAKQALSQALALRMFPVAEFGLFFVALLLYRFSFSKDARPSATRFAVMAGVVVILTGGFTALWGIDYVPFAFEFALGLLLSLQSSAVAVTFLLALTLIRPWESSGIEQMAFIPKTIGLLAIASWIFQGLRMRKLSILFNWPCRLFLAFAAWVLFSAVIFNDIAQGLGAFLNSMFVASVLFFLVANVPAKEEDLRLITRGLVISVATVIAHASLMTFFRETQDGLRLEGIGLTGNANDLAALAVLALPFAVIPALAKSRVTYDRWLAYITVPIFLYGLWLAESRGALLAVGLSAASFLILRAKRPGRAIFLGVLCLPILFSAIAFLSLARSSQDIQGSTESRLGYVIAGLRMVAHNPILGVGFLNYPKLYESYSSGDFTYEWGQRTAHSTWILALAETGIPGFLLFSGLFLSVFKRAWKLRRVRPELLSAMLGYGVAMSFLSHTYTFFPYLLFAIVLAAAKQIQNLAKASHVRVSEAMENGDGKSVVVTDPHPVSWDNARASSE